MRKVSRRSDVVVSKCVRLLETRGYIEAVLGSGGKHLLMADRGGWSAIGRAISVVVGSNNGGGRQPF